MERGGPDERSSDAGALGDLARELRAGAGDAFRAEAEEGERLAARAALRRRTLVDVAVAAAERGETLTVLCGERRFSGGVRHAAKDLLTIVAPGGPVHVNLAGAVVVHVGRAGPGRDERTGEDTPSFKARLFELELAGTELDVGIGVSPGELVGCIRAVAVDHVLVDADDGERWAVALGSVRWVRERRPARPR